ncbi:unnamed protein product [Gongylonema pulchrum]|uniref:Uncharacterized protein n=1 Tax=Gongylonema pulchrum TaxID=637853 RepID=A0A3P6QUX5_9BILA|nr:unnamed protein product [Gongylonema pulchrum]
MLSVESSSSDSEVSKASDRKSSVSSRQQQSSVGIELRERASTASVPIPFESANGRHCAW